MALALLTVAFAAGVHAQAKPVDVAAFTAVDQFELVKISPTGEYLAATMPLEDRSALVILRRSDKKVTASVQFGEHEFINDFHYFLTICQVFFSNFSKKSDFTASFC